jgi:endonuclease/exonuclease/phosphatase (EEP) superfamily protein YafD
MSQRAASSVILRCAFGETKASASGADGVIRSRVRRSGEEARCRREAGFVGYSDEVSERGRAAGEANTMWRVVRGLTLVLLGFATAGFLVLTVAGFLGRRWWVFELIANLRPHLLGALLVCTLLFAVLRHLPLVVVATVGTLLNLAVLAPLLLPSQPAQPEADAATLEVTFFNTKIRAADPEEVADYLSERDDDIVVLAATSSRWVNRMTEADLGLTVVSGTRTHPGLELLTLVREPDVQVVVHEPSEHDRDALVEIRTSLQGRPVHLLATHAVSPQTAERAARRDRSLTWIAEWARTTQADQVVMGDLNATPWSPTFRDMVTEAELVDPLRSHRGLQASWPAELGPLGIPIDHVLHGPGLTTLDRSLGPSFGSDHRMVHATLAPAATP